MLWAQFGYRHGGAVNGLPRTVAEPARINLAQPGLEHTVTSPNIVPLAHVR